MPNAALSSPASALRTSARFTLDGSDELEAHLSNTCERVLAELLAVLPAKRLDALLLGGGYGRGEGGVLKTGAGDRPYNDLEFYVCLRGSQWFNERRFGPALHSVAEDLSPVAGVEVEFKLLPIRKLQRSPISMFYYDLVMGHRQLGGAEGWLARCAHHCVPQQIPLSEATRLLMNRCSGLLFAQEQLQRPSFTPENADFTGRNLAKAQLAFGDVVLTAHGQYHWSCRERGRRVQSISSDFPLLREVQRHHPAGVEFKLHPSRAVASRAALQEQLQELSALGLQLWLWLERRRLDYHFAGISEYAVSGLDKCPETKWWRNYLINLKSFGAGALVDSRSIRYPRERILRASPLLLWAPELFSERPLLQLVQNALGTSAADFSALIDAYRALWSRFN